jgi:hypothetical protein
MKARVGDQLITEGADGQRACVIIGLHHGDGSPPYVVRWLSDGHIALMFPGPYAKLVHPGPEDDAAQGTTRAQWSSAGR